METDHELNAVMDAKYPGERDSRRKIARILRARLKLFGVDESKMWGYDND